MSETATPAAPAAPTAPAAEAVDPGRIEAFARETVARYHGDQSVKAAEMAIRFAKTARSMTEVPTLLGEFFGTVGRGGNPAPVPVVTAPSNTGAPTAPPSAATLPENPWQWPQDAIDRLTLDERRELIEEWEQKHGGGNPFAAMRQRFDEVRAGRRYQNGRRVK